MHARTIQNASTHQRTHAPRCTKPSRPSSSLTNRVNLTKRSSGTCGEFYRIGLSWGARVFACVRACVRARVSVRTWAIVSLYTACTLTGHVRYRCVFCARTHNRPCTYRVYLNVHPNRVWIFPHNLCSGISHPPHTHLQAHTHARARARELTHSVLCCCRIYVHTRTHA